MRLRGALARPFFGSCGKHLTLERNLDFRYPNNIFIGENVFIGVGSVFLAIGRIHIADKVLIAPYCVIATGNHTYFNGAYRNGAQDVKSVSVGHGSWLGSHVVLTPGATVGSGTCVAAGAVVVGKIDDNMVAGGIPARVIKKTNEQE
jgi:maltose O-acetyltransferase